MGFNVRDFFKGRKGAEGGKETAAAVGEAVEYKGYAIRAAPERQGAQWLTAGTISKPFEDGVKEHRFVRADTFSSKDDAADCAVQKAKRVIDEQGDRMFVEE